MIEFKEKRVVRFHDFQKRNENHGPDLVPAIDIHITIKGPASDLAMIHKDLPEMLFSPLENATPADGQAAMDLPIDALAHVRAPCVKSKFKCDNEQAGMLLTIDHGLGDKSDIQLALVKLSKVEVSERVEGGFAVWTLMLSCANEINETVIGKVAMLEGYEITIALTAPELEQPQQDLTVGDVFGDLPPEAPELTAEDIFVNQSKPAAKNSKLGRAIAASEKAAAKRQGKAT